MGTRVLRVNLKALIGLLPWPVQEGTYGSIKQHALPDDCRFVRVVRVDDPYVHVLLMSSTWHGDHPTPLLVHPEFSYESRAGRIILPSDDDHSLIGRGN